MEEKIVELYDAWELSKTPEGKNWSLLPIAREGVWSLDTPLTRKFLSEGPSGMKITIYRIRRAISNIIDDMAKDDADLRALANELLEVLDSRA